MAVRHKFVLQHPDGPDATQVRPSNWNAEHDVDPATEAAAGIVQLAASGEVTPGRVVQASDSRLAFSLVEKNALELHMAFRAANLANFKQLTYVDGKLAAIDVWEAPSMATKLFRKTMGYDPDGTLRQTVVTRVADNAVITRDFTYDGDGNIVAITSS